ncbi:Insulinase (Peptidase M16) [Kappamyces sp. JEL0829]|nr:Insulinase (Peptidase M16) [Kappamyces sp. JEL0829]
MSIVKPQTDSRDYAAITLENGLEILLISDPATDKSSAALDCHVGSLSDPRDLPGLAHFLEHLLFMGTKTYPSENEYSSFLSKHGGRSNAFTSGDHTNYFFDVHADFLEGALDRFSKFFIEPLFLESCIDRELQAVHSEHEKNLTNDSWKVFQLFKELSDPSHPFCCFGTGNMQTLNNHPKALGINVRDALLAFHAKYYSANIMKLVILGKEPLDTLKQWGREKFSAIETKGLDPPPFPIPHSPGLLKTVVCLKPVKDLRNLILLFPCSDHRDDYRTHPLSYYSHLFGHESAGSILSLLKNRGWAQNLSSGLSHYGSRGFEFFKITVEMTAEGLHHHQDILEIIFQYVQMLKQTGVQKWIYDECKLVSRTSFQFREKSSPSSYTSQLSGYMHDFVPEDILRGNSMMEQFDANLIEACLDYFSPDNLVVMVQANGVDTGNGEPDWSEDQWYKTKYWTRTMAPGLLERLSRPETHPELQLPTPNSFLPENFALSGSKADSPLKHPWIIAEQDALRLWFKADDRWMVPKGYLNLEIRSRHAYDNVRNCVLTRLYTLLLKDAINEFYYFAELSGLRFELENTTQGLHLYISGYNCKMHVLLESILNVMTNLRPREEDFRRIKDSLQRQYTNWFRDSPYTHASYFVTAFTQEKLFSTQSKLDALHGIGLQDVASFVPSLFEHCKLEGLVLGNFTRESALALGSLSLQYLKPRTPIEDGLVLKTVLLPPTSLIIENPVYNPDDANSAIEYTVQLGCVANERIRVLGSLLAQIAQEPAFNELRTKEQLGYIVFSGLKKQTEMLSFRIIIQSIQDALYLEHRIEAFLQTLQDTIEHLTPEEFSKHKSTLSKSLKEDLKNLSQESSRMWSHITSQYYTFELNEQDAERIQEISHSELLGFYRDTIMSPRKSKISVHMKSAKANGNYTEEQLSLMKAIMERSTVLAGYGGMEALKPTLELSQIPVSDVSSFKQ